MQGPLCFKGKCMMSLLCVLPTQLHSDTLASNKSHAGMLHYHWAQYRKPSASHAAQIRDEGKLS
jgi:hypothetical protein